MIRWRETRPAHSEAFKVKHSMFWQGWDTWTPARHYPIMNTADLLSGNSSLAQNGLHLFSEPLSTHHSLWLTNIAVGGEWRHFGMSQLEVIRIMLANYTHCSLSPRGRSKEMHFLLHACRLDLNYTDSILEMSWSRQRFQGEPHLLPQSKGKNQGALCRRFYPFLTSF